VPVFRFADCAGFALGVFHVVSGAPIPVDSTRQFDVGREDASLAMEEFSQVKYICSNWV
jgi:hypothetical protein